MRRTVPVNPAPIAPGPVRVAYPPAYVVGSAPSRLEGIPEGAVIVADWNTLQPVLSDLNRCFGFLQSSAPSSSLVAAVPAERYSLMTQVLASVARWRGTPVLLDASEQLSVTALRRALSDSELLVDQLIQWFAVLHPRSVQCQVVLNALFSAPITASLSESLAGTGFNRRSAGRQLRRAGLPSATQLRRIAKGVRLAAALQEPRQVAVERVAHRFGLTGGSQISHFLATHWGIGGSDVRDTLGWRWLAFRLNRASSRGHRVDLAKKRPRATSRYK